MLFARISGRRCKPWRDRRYHGCGERVSGIVLIGSNGLDVVIAPPTEKLDCISQRSAVTVAVLVQQAATVGVSPLTLPFLAPILQREVQTIHLKAEEVGVTVGSIVVTTLLHKVVSAVGVAAELRQNVGPEVNTVIGYAVVTTIIEGACVS